MDPKTVWHDVLESLRVSVSGAIFSTWFSQTHIANIVDSKGRVLVEIGCATSFVKTTIESRYFGLVQDSLSKYFGKATDIAFVVKENPEKIKKDETLSSPLFKTDTSTNDDELKNNLQRSKIRLGFTFENFAVSPSNQMAWAASEAVAQNPGTAYNPLFIYGGVGVGKSHLMIAIGHSVIKASPETKALFCTGEDFTNDIVEGIRNKTTPAVRNKYRKLDVLLIDDIQFIAGKDTAQEEFFHTFNAVTGAGGQVVLTSDRPPSEISKLEERLRSRFEAGLIVDVAPPDFELRCAIIQIKAKESGVEIPMDLVQTIAGNLDSARKIQGFLVKLLTELKLKRLELTPELISSLLSKGGQQNGESIKAKPEEVITAVSKYFSIGKRQLMSASRARPFARPRQVLMYFLRIELGLPLTEVGRIAGRDHTTVMHAVKKITSLASNDVKIREDISGIKQNL